MILSQNFLLLSSFFLISTAQAQRSFRDLPTSVPVGYDGLGSIFKAMCGDDGAYTQPNLKEAVDLGCRRKNRKGANFLNPATGFILRTPRVYKPAVGEGFAVPGNPYIMVALDYQRRKIRNTGGKDHVVMNENCEVVGVLTEYKSSLFKKNRYEKCFLEMYLRKKQPGASPGTSAGNSPKSSPGRSFKGRVTNPDTY